MLPKYPYYCLQILIPILSSATIQIVRKAWVEGKTTLGTAEGLQEDVFTLPTKLKLSALSSTQDRDWQQKDISTKVDYIHNITLTYNQHLRSKTRAARNFSAVVRISFGEDNFFV